jgi:hypothetical protein
MARGDAPQTVGEALESEWRWLAVRCGLCRRRARIPLTGRPRGEALATIGHRLKCRRCPPHQSYDFHLVREWRTFSEKPILFDGMTTRKLGMN